MSLSSRFKAMQAALQTSTPESGTSDSNRYYPLGKLEFDQAVTVRFLPDKNPDNPLGFLSERLSHNLTINGQYKQIPCLTQYGMECPICAQAKEFYANNQDDLGSQFYHKRNYVAQVLVIDDPLGIEVDPTNPAKLLGVGKQVFGIIKEAILSGELENDPDQFTNGYSFVIKKTKGGAKPGGGGFFPQYTLGTRFLGKRTTLDPELVALIEPNLLDLSTTLPRAPDLASVEADLQAALVSAGVVQPSASARNSMKSSAPKTPAPAASNDDDGDGEEAPAANSGRASAAELLARLQRKS